MDHTSDNGWLFRVKGNVTTAHPLWEFLTSLFNNGLGYSSINTARSALCPAVKNVQ